MRRSVAVLIALAAAVGATALPALAGRSPQLPAAADNAAAAGENHRDRPGSGVDNPENPEPSPDGETAPPPSEEAPPAEGPAASVCTDAVDTAVRFSIPVPNATEPATGFYALPPVRPEGMVVFSHGYGHSSYSWQHHLTRVAKAHNVVAVAMDGRGLTFLSTEKAPGIPNTAGWPVQAAAEDGIAAARLFEAACPSIETVVNYGVSMGGNTSGIMAAAGAKRLDGTPLFDWWVDIEGVNNLVETYFEARLAAPDAARVIEAENGGTFEQQPDAYRHRTNALRAGDMKAAGLRGVVLVHGVDDGLVPHNQSQEMFAALTAAGIPAQFFVVTLKSDESERETTGTGIVAGRVDPQYRSPLAGHASEMSTTHIVSVTGFERLDAIFAGRPPACTRLAVVDGQAGSTPLVDC